MKYTTPPGDLSQDWETCGKSPGYESLQVALWSKSCGSRYRGPNPTTSGFETESASTKPQMLAIEICSMFTGTVR